MDLGPIDQVVRARAPHRLPVVLTREEVAAVLQQLDGRLWLMVALLYGAGLRLRECLELRVKDIDFGQNQLIVRPGERSEGPHHGVAGGGEGTIGHVPGGGSPDTQA
jgi:integrase